MFGFIIKWVLGQIQQIIDAKTELFNSLETAQLTKTSSDLLKNRLKSLKAKQSRDDIREKIIELEEENELEYENDDIINPEKPEDKLIGELFKTILSKNQPTDTSQQTLSSGFSPQVIEIIKNAKTPKELYPLAKKYFPTADESTINTIWESMR